jgi:hypothetical protein
MMTAPLSSACRFRFVGSSHATDAHNLAATSPSITTGTSRRVTCGPLFDAAASNATVFFAVSSSSSARSIAGSRPSRIATGRS